MSQTFDKNNLQIIDLNTFNVSETTVDTNKITTDTNVDLNAFETTNIESKFQTTEITPTFLLNVQETTNIDINTYSISEPIIDTTTTNDNFDINTLIQTEIPSSFDINAIPETKATENFDIINIAVIMNQ